MQPGPHPPQDHSPAAAQWRQLRQELAAEVAGEVQLDARAQALYGRDASHYRQAPLGVVYPRDATDVEAAVAICHARGVPILPRGTGTSIAGQTVNRAVVLDLRRHMDRILELDVERCRARVQPGVVLDDLRDAASPHGLTFGPDPATHAWCTLGGMIGNNSCGVHSVMAGKTDDNVEALEVLTYDGCRLVVGATTEKELEALIAAGGRRGQIFRALRELRETYAEQIRTGLPRIPRRVSGYGLDHLLPEAGFHVARALVGTEGTCVTVLEATLRLVPSPPHRVLVLLGYPDLGAAGDASPAVMGHGPIGLEGTDLTLIENMRAKGLEAAGLRLLPEGRCWLMAEFGAETREAALEPAQALLEEALGLAGGATGARLLEAPAEMRAVWAAREAGAGASSRLADGTDAWGGWEDAAVDPLHLGDYLRAFQALIRRYGYRASMYGHFGQGCIHTRLDFDLTTRAGIARYRSFVEEGARLVVAHGGSLSGEHGDGHARAELLPIMYGPELMEAFRWFKRTWDPDGGMNPGKVVDPYRLDEHLHLGEGYRPPEHRSFLTYPQDEGRFARAASRCVGVGKCTRVHQGGTMCPSYRVTLEEQHSTRGRAHLLEEMSEGRLPGGWGSTAVREALELCLSCKSCRKECPAGVDVATYRAEFLAHHHQRYPRHPREYLFGWIHRWLRLAELAPSVVNAAAGSPLAGPLRRVLGLAHSRTPPRVARRTFLREARRRSPGGVFPPVPGAPDRGEVVLWADTFSNHLDPPVAHAALRVLTGAGFTVRLPRERICCGRPLYDAGMLPRARRQLRHLLQVLRPAIDAGIPVVGLEPSCISVIRDELLAWFPHDPRAHRLAATTHTLGELLRRHAPDFQPPPRQGQALLHAHCHHEAVLDPSPDRALLERAGLQVETPDTGCCGMAGSFGFRADREALSIAIAERVLLPAIRALPEGALVVTDGFSCREQIRQCLGRQALHLAQALA